MSKSFCSSGGAAFSSDKQDWETPQDLYDKLNAEFHFTLDPCSSDKNAKCQKHFTEKDNGLLKSWSGETVFCNPPYGREISKWVKKCSEESRHAIVVMLIPARTDTSYFHDYIYHKAEIRFLRGRIKFGCDGVEIGPAPFPSMIVVFRNKDDK